MLEGLRRLAIEKLGVTDEQINNAKIGTFLLFLNEKYKDYKYECRKARENGEDSPGILESLGDFL